MWYDICQLKRQGKKKKQSEMDQWFYHSPGHITGMKMTEAKESQVKITMNCRCKILLLVTVGALIEGSGQHFSKQFSTKTFPKIE